MLFKFTKRRPVSVPQATLEDQSTEAQSTRESLQSSNRLRFSQLVQKSKVLLTLPWTKDAQIGTEPSRPRTIYGERFRGLRSSSVLDIVQTRPSLSPDLISHPIRPGSCHNHPNSHARHCSRSEVDLRLPSRHISSHPPRFGSVVRREVPRYSTFARPTHSTIMSGDTINLTTHETIHVVSNEDGTVTLADVPVPDTPPPAYSRFDPGQPISEL